MNSPRSIRKSALINILSFNSLTVLGIISSMVLARLLKPTEVGTYAVVAVLVALAQQFRDFGTANYVVQTKDLTTEALSRAFGLAILSAWSIGLIMLAVSPIIAMVYRSDEILHIFLILAFNTFLIPFGSITLALLRRDLLLKERAVIDHASALASLILSIGLAWMGLGAKSLAWAAVGATVTTIVVSMMVRPAHYKWKVSLKGIGEVAKYGASVTASTIIANLNNGLVELISGRIVGLQTVGFYNKARSVTDMINALMFSMAGQIAMPVMASHYHKTGSITSMYLRSVTLITGIAWPACVMGALFPSEIIQIMFGPQWAASAPMLRTLCLLSIVTTSTLLWAYALFAVGEAHRVFKGEVAVCVSTALILVALLSTHITDNLALAVVATMPISQFYIYRQLKHVLKFSHRDYLDIYIRSGKVLIISCFLPFLMVIFQIHPNNALLTLLIAGTLTGLCWFAGIFMTKHPLMDEVQTACTWLRKKFA